MKFSEFEYEVEEATREYELAIARCDAFTEASFNEYFNNIEEGSLRVESENGSYEDFLSLKEAAEESFGDRAKKTIKKILDACANTIKRIVNAIKSLFQKKDVEDLKKIKKETTVNIPDPKALKKEEEIFDHAVKKEYSKFKAGKKIDKDALNEAERKYEARKKAITAATITVGALIVTAIVIDAYQATKEDNPVPGDLRTVENFTGSNDPEQQGDNVIMAKFMSKVAVEKWMNNSKIIKWFKNAAQGVKDVATGPSKELPSIVKGKMEQESADLDLLDTIIEEVEHDMNNELTVEEYLEDVERSVGILPPLPVQDLGDYLLSIEQDLGIVHGDEYKESNTQGARADQKRLDMIKNQTNRQDAVVKQSKGKIEKVDEATLRVPLGQAVYFPRYVNGELTVMAELQKGSGGVQAGTQIDPKGYNNGQLFSQVKQVLMNPQVKQFFAQLRNMNEVNQAVDTYLKGFRPQKVVAKESTSTFF